MKFIDKLERKFGNRGIENLTIYIIVSYVLGYALMYINQIGRASCRERV